MINDKKLYCPRCGNEMVSAIVGKGKNVGRPYKKCTDANHFSDSFVFTDKWFDFKKFAKPAPLGMSSNPANKQTNKAMRVGGGDVPRGAGVLTKTLGDVEESDDPLAFLGDVQVPVTLKQKLVWSEYQEEIFRFVAGDNGHAVVSANAGAAKTTTGIECTNRIPHSAEVAYLAFGVDIVATLKERAPDHVYVNTTHALALANVRAQYPNVVVDEYKLANLWDKEIDQFGQHGELKPTCLRLVNGLKATLLAPDQEGLDYLVDRYSVEVNGAQEKIYELTHELFYKSLEQTRVLDFEDMLYWCATEKVETRKFDFIFGDEYQDMTTTQTWVIKKSLTPNGRAICFGDKWQSLYGFRFADVDSMDNAIRDYNATVLPLPVSYRCPTSVIGLAQKIVPSIQARPDAPMGRVYTTGKLPPLLDGDVVLCRMNKFLVKECLKLIRNKQKAGVLGRGEIGNNMVSMLLRGETKARSRDINTVRAWLSNYSNAEAGRLERNKKASQAESLLDRFDTLTYIMEECQSRGEQSTRDVMREINAIFTSEKKGVLFSTVHKYKGNEADRIFVIEPRLFNPQKYDVQEWELQQLRNLNYVGVTRAKSELCFVGDMPEAFTDHAKQISF